MGNSLPTHNIRVSGCFRTKLPRKRQPYFKAEILRVLCYNRGSCKGDPKRRAPDFGQGKGEEVTAQGDRVTPLKHDPRLVLKGTRRLPGKITWL